MLISKLSRMLNTIGQGLKILTFTVFRDTSSVFYKNTFLMTK